MFWTHFRKEVGNLTQVDMRVLLDVMERLLAPDGCPWDRAQTHSSMRKHMIEEAYEVCDAIDRGDAANLREELGDVLYQVVFHAALAEREGLFSLQDVIDEVAEKMRRRHPFIWPAEEGAATGDWESIKRAEKAARGQSAALLACLPVTLKLEKLVAKCKKHGLSQEALLACCDDERQRALLTLVMAYAETDDTFEFSAQALTKKLEKCLENL